MLRVLVAALVVANLALIGWTIGWIEFGSEREPDRLNHQVNPKAIEIIAPGAASTALAQVSSAAAPQPIAVAAASAPATADTAAPSTSGQMAVEQRFVCLEAGPFATAELAAAERALRELQLSTLAWTQVKTDRGGAFIVYQGKFADEAALARRREELRRAQIPFDEVRNSPDLQPGISFGRYESRAAADKALEELRQRGARAARVVVITPSVTATLLRVERADATQATRLTQASLPPTGTPFRPCAATP